MAGSGNQLADNCFFGGGNGLVRFATSGIFITTSGTTYQSFNQMSVFGCCPNSGESCKKYFGASGDGIDGTSRTFPQFITYGFDPSGTYPFYNGDLGRYDGVSSYGRNNVGKVNGAGDFGKIDGIVGISGAWDWSQQCWFSLFGAPVPSGLNNDAQSVQACSTFELGQEGDQGHPESGYALTLYFKAERAIAGNEGWGLTIFKKPPLLRSCNTPGTLAEPEVAMVASFQSIRNAGLFPYSCGATGVIEECHATFCLPPGCYTACVVGNMARSTSPFFMASSPMFRYIKLVTGEHGENEENDDPPFTG